MDRINSIPLPPIANSIWFYHNFKVISFIVSTASSGSNLTQLSDKYVQLTRIVE